ncbi:MAG: helix-turn-helix domain-containing protein [Rhodospirillales bacterium]
MPWEVSSVLERRIRFVLDVERGELPLTAVCEAHGISRTTGYKWLERHASWVSAGSRIGRARPAGWRGPWRGDCVGDRGGAHALSALGAEEAAGMVCCASSRRPAGRRHRRWAICCAGVV